jgi:hypothetical protein|tara:strand:- start:2549 stop:3289 length:741 start_codon:yes stop_codon:yes gene_type:complete
MINSLADAQERVRLILDRADSPWLTSTELNGFIELSINEYLRERVNVFGSNQKLRDDFSKFVKSAVFRIQPWGDEDDDLQTYKRQFTNYGDTGNWLGGSVTATYPGGEWGYSTTAGTGCYVGEINFGTLLEIKVKRGTTGLSECKIMSIDDALRASKDPFNQPGTGSAYHAVRVGDYYWVLPGITNVNYSVVMTYVSNLNSASYITWLPVHAREEVCQIATRKILGAVADERMPVADNEIKQLEGK